MPVFQRLSFALLLLSGAALASACTTTVTNPEDPYISPNASAEPKLTFGETGEEPASTDGPGLFSTPTSNPNPKTLAGVYERTGYASESRPSDYVVIQNEWRSRLEIRNDMIVAGTECKIKVGGRTDETKTVYAYVSSPIVVEPWGVRIEKAQKDTGSWPEYAVDCSVDIADETWPYCIGDAVKVPEGYSSCVYLDTALQLSVKKIAGSVGVMGKKIRN